MGSKTNPETPRGDRVKEKVLKNYLTIDGLALYLKISKPTIYKWVKNKTIPYIRVKNVIRFDAEKIDAFMEKNEVA
jgi:excisionase family DNA binding protein